MPVAAWMNPYSGDLDEINGHALAGVIHRARSGEFDSANSVLFWHTGGQPSAIV